MFFRNLTLFRFSAAVAARLGELEAALEEHRLRPCGPLEMTTRGFVAPAGSGEDEPLVRAIGHHLTFSVGSEDKLLPAAVVNRELRQKVRKLAAAEGRPVGGRERKRIKAEVLDELLPRAFARPSEVAGYLDTQQGWLVLDSSSRKAAENVVSTLRDALGSFPAVPLAPEQSPRQLMTEWLSGSDLPAGLGLGDECELRDPSGTGGAIVRCRHQDLAGDEVHQHLRAGKQVFQLGLEFEDRIGFVLGEDLVVRKLRFFDVVTDELEAIDTDSAGAEFDATQLLMAGEITRLLARLQDWFTLPRPADD